MQGTVKKRKSHIDEIQTTMFLTVFKIEGPLGDPNGGAPVKPTCAQPSPEIHVKPTCSSQRNHHSPTSRAGIYSFFLFPGDPGDQTHGADNKPV